MADSAAASSPPTLTRLGRSAWLVLGVLVLLVATATGIALLLPVLAPVVMAVVIAAVLLPLVEWLSRRGMPRAASAGLATLLVPAILGVVTVLVVRGVRGEGGNVRATMEEAGRQLRAETGADPISGLLDADKRDFVLGLVTGVVDGVAAAISWGFGLLIGLYVLFFLLKDAPRFAAYAEARLPLPGVATREMLGVGRRNLSRYIVGTTAIAVMDAVAIALGAVVLDLPLIAVIALVTFVAAYVPYLGAWVSGAFAVVIALGAGGVDTALWMLVIVLFTQNIMEGLARPFAFGVALDMHPLAVMGVTAVGAALGGFLGVFIAPPAAAIAVAWYKIAKSAQTDGGGANGDAAAANGDPAAERGPADAIDRAATGAQEVSTSPQ
jgi:predicted PurR-regulated permease PerM